MSSSRSDVVTPFVRPFVRPSVRLSVSDLLFLFCPLKDRIVIGRHSLENSGSGKAHHARYEDQNTGRYDGVHLYGYTGRKDYTNSVKTILMLAMSETGFGTAQTGYHNSCPQAKYQKEKYQPTVDTRNRFSVLNSNQGN